MDTLCWHAQHFTSSAALLYLWISWLSFLLSFYQWNFSKKEKQSLLTPFNFYLSPNSWKSAAERQWTNKHSVKFVPVAVQKVIDDSKINWRKKLKMHLHKSKNIFIMFPSQRDRLKKLGRYKATASVKYCIEWTDFQIMRRKLQSVKLLLENILLIWSISLPLNKSQILS